MNILISSTDADHRQLLSMLFQRAGDVIITCPTLRAATNWVEVEPPDVALVNPWEDGSLEPLRQTLNVFWHHHVPMVFITTRVTAEELTLLEEFKPNLVIRLPEEMDRSLPERIRRLRHQPAA